MMGKFDCRLRRGAAAACPDATITKKARYLLKEEPADQTCGAAVEAFFASLVCDGAAQDPNQMNHGAKRVPDCWQRWTRAPYYDGHEWRKYGEKYIASVGSKRCYYRCTHTPCPAKKRVENRRIGDPTLYLVTYEKEHTCNAAPAATHHQLTLDPPSPPAAPFSLSFYSHDCRMDQQQLFQSAFGGQITAGTPEISNGSSSSGSCCSSSFVSTPPTMTPAGSMEMENYDLEDVDLGDLDVLLWMD